MAQYWLDFADDTVGNAPAGLTKRWTTTGLTLTVQSDVDAPSGKSVRVQKTALSRSAVTVDAVDSDADRDDCEIRVLIRTPSSYSADASSPIVYGLVRGSGASSAETAYCGGLDYTTSGPSRVASMRKYVGGTLTANIDTLTNNPAFSDSTEYWLRFKASGTTLDRGLAPMSTPSTETWTVSDTGNSDITTAGWIGMLVSADADWDILAIGIGTNGDAAPTESPTATVVIRDDYERSSVNLTGSSVSGVGDEAVITIKPRIQETEAIGGTRWLEPSARIDNVQDIRPTFKFIDYAATAANGKYHGAPWATTRKPMFSYDRESWHYFASVTVNDSDITFRHDAAFTQDTIYVSRSRQLSVAQVGEWLEAMAVAYPSIFSPAQSALDFTPTLTTWPGQSFIADEFSPQTNELGTTIPATPFYAAKISGGSTLAILSCGVHAGEDHSDYVYQSTVEYLCGSSAEAQALRQRYTILLYPMVNAPGRAGGGWRGSFTQGPGGEDDLNRHFSDSDTTLEIIDIPKAVILSDVGSAMPSWALDFHGVFNLPWGMYQGDTVVEDYRDRVATATGYTISDMGEFTSDAIGLWYGTELGATLATVVEFGDPSPVTDEQIETYAQGAVETLYDMSTDKTLPWDWSVKGTTITLHAGTTPQASITDIVALWWDAISPSGAPDYSTNTASTDASGVLTLDLDAATALEIGASGFLLLYKLDVTDHRDSLVFAGRVAVSDVS